MKTEAYDDFLIKCIRKAVAFAGNDELTIYINPTDEKNVLIWKVLQEFI